MTNTNDFSAEADVEAMIRAAGDYLQPSIDLRPQVLEAARTACHERGWQRIAVSMAAIVLLVATLGEAWWLRVTTIGKPSRLEAAASLRSPVSVSQSLRSPAIFRTTPVLAAGSVQTSVENTVVAGDDWNLVESFTEMRRRQARVLRLDL